MKTPPKLSQVHYILNKTIWQVPPKMTKSLSSHFPINKEIRNARDFPQK
ncbi:hypothetical protein STRIC_2076 [Streptococcus ictaluri 707-05]|uniref:Uncharacterized protein n=1 Tax=Streptococcus ictaluri 707-05 TaxID=764299 RepID=G5K5G1_9STRE|nr:hypothetical protein STRIC_2076 [Streptococcus ictaluri 707-05]